MRGFAAILVVVAGSLGCLTDRVLTVGDDGVVVVNDDVVDRARAATEDRRGLPFVRKVPLEVLSAAELTTWLNRYYDDAATALVKRDRFFHKMGILPPTRDTAAAYKGFVGDYAGGIYDDDRLGADGQKGTMILVHDYAWWSKVQLDLFGFVTGVDYAYETFLTHELTHALQDQHLHLDRLLDDARNDDVRMVQKTILESEANVVGMSYFAGLDLRHVVPRTAFFLFLRYNNFFNAPIVTAASGRSSSFFARQAFSQYELGLGFVEERLAAGEWADLIGDDDGGALAELSRAYVRVPGTKGALPESTEQLLFPWKRGDTPDRPERLLALPRDDVSADNDHASDDVDSAEAPRRWRGQRVIASGVFGALALKHWLDGSLGFGAEGAVDGWGGDRYELLVDDDDHTIIVWRLLADTDSDAQELFSALRERLRAAYASPASPDRIVVDPASTDRRFVAVVGALPAERKAVRTDRAEHLAIERRGRAVVIVNGLDAATSLAPVVDDLFVHAVAAPRSVDDDRRRVAVAAELERTLEQTLAARVPPVVPLSSQLLLPARTVAVRLGVDVARFDFDPDHDVAVVPGVDIEARWGVRSFLELALPFAATLHAPLGPFDVAIGVAPHTLPINRAADGIWSATALGTAIWTSGDIGLAAQLDATPSVRFSNFDQTRVSSSYRVGALLRPMSWLVLQPGIEVARTGVVDADTARSDEVLRIGGILQRGFIDAPLIELELLSGLKLWSSTSTSWRLANPGTSAVSLQRIIEQRFSAGLLVLF